jgi:broad specificity phosphatase PhoE
MPGFEQAKYIAQYLKEQVSPKLIVTSTHKRTKQTADLTLSRLPDVPLEVWPVHEFTYLSSEEFLEPSGVEDRKPLVEVYWELCDPTLVDGPGSESFQQFIERVRGVIKRITDSSYETIAIFSHEQFIRAVQWLTEGDPVILDSEAMHVFKDKLRSNPLVNGAILRTQFHNDQERWNWEQVTSHLVELVP